MADNSNSNSNGAATRGPGAGQPGAGQPGAGQPGATESQKPSMRILAQYLKDFSFENPNAPQSLTSQSGQPKIDISVNVNAKTLAQTDYEVEIQLEVKAASNDSVVFQVEMLYAGVFRLEGIPQEMLHPVVLIECPRMLFPFARQILADATRNGGFPPLMLDPIDFAAMYQQRADQNAQASAGIAQA